MRIAVLTSCLALTGCWSSLSESRPPDIVALGLTPQNEVALDGVVTIELSAPLAPLAGPCPVRLVRADLREVEVDCTLHGDDRLLQLSARMLWPGDERLTVAELDLLQGRAGEAVVGPEQPLTFRTVRPPVTPQVSVEGPEPGSLAPVNLRRIVATVRGVEHPVDAITLARVGHSLRVPVVAQDDRGRVVAELQDALDPSATYRIEVDGQADGEPTLQSFVRTGTVPDLQPPDLRLRGVDRGGGSLRLTIESDEPVFASGRAIEPGGAWIELVAPLMPSAHVELVAARRLRPDTRYALVVEARDYAGLAAAPLEVQIVTPPDVRVRITELVPTPLHDWNDVAPGTPFDAFPGSGAVTDSDEWLELVNTSAAPIDLTQVHLRLRLIDGTPSEHDLLAAAHLHFGRRGEVTSWGVGEALVVRPRGAMAQRDLVVEVCWGDLVLDHVALGREAAAEHAGGAPPDLEHEAIARDDTGAWRWCVPTPGDPWPGDCVR